MRKIALLGSTGSIGVSTLRLVREFPDRFKVHGMVAGKNIALLARQIKAFRPKLVAIRDESDVARLRKLLGSTKVEILHGQAGASAVATAPEIDVVLAAIVVFEEIVAEGVVVDTGGTVGITGTAAEASVRSAAVLLVESVEVELLVEKIDEIDEFDRFEVLEIPATPSPTADKAGSPRFVPRPDATTKVEGTVGTTPNAGSAGSGMVGIGSIAGTEPTLRTVVSITAGPSWSTVTPLRETLRTPQRVDTSERSCANSAEVSTRPVTMASRPSKRICTPRIFVWTP